MSGEYRGETDAKRGARLLLLESIQRQMRDVTAGTKFKALCLAGDGGDARMLRALGVPVSDIIVVDRDEGAIRKVEELLPGADFRHGDIRVAIGTLEESSVAIAMLDFCGHMSRAVQNSIQLLAPKLQIPSWLSVTYLRGREAVRTPWIAEERKRWERGGPGLQPHEKMQAYREGYGSRVAALITRNRRWDETIYVLGPVHRDACAVRIRGTSVTEVHPNACLPVEGSWWLDERDLIRYHSGSSPMGVLTLCLSRDRPQVPCLQRGFKPAAIERGLRRWAAAHPGTAQRVADFLNLPLGTIAAWRAHATRGTYQGS